MAFWGVEVRPGNPFTHFFDPQRGRLHISQATLGNGSASQKSVVQCNVGDKSPVLLCVLLPDKTESCGLALEFEEAEDVTFSVVGPRSVYLTGYYLGHLRNSEFYDDIEPPGEDIENTDSEEADLSDGEDDSDDSFINDGDPEYFSPSPSPIPDSGGDNDGEEPGDLKPRKRKGRKRRKKYQFSDSDDGGHVQISKEVDGRDRAIGLGSDDEKLPNSSPRKTNDFGNNSEVEPEKRDEDDIGMVTKNAGNSMEVEPEERNDKELAMITKNTENDTELEPSKGDKKDIGLVIENSENMEVEPKKWDDKELGMEANDYENNIDVGPEEGHGKDIGMATKKSENNLEVEPEKGDGKDIGMSTRNSENNMKIELEERDDKETSMVVKHSENKIKVGPEERDDKETSMVVKHSKNKIEVGPEERDGKEVDMATKNSENNMEVVPDKKDYKELCMIEVEPEEIDVQEIDMATKNFENNMEVKPEAWNAEEVGLVTKNPEDDKELEPGKRDGKEIGMETNKDDICVAETSPESNACLIDGDAKRQSDLSCKPLLPCPRPVSVEKEAKPKKKSKQLSEESTGEKATKVGVEKKKKHQEDLKSGNKKVNNLLSSEVMVDGPIRKKRRKERSKETDTVEADSVVPAEDKEGNDTRKEVNIRNDEFLNDMDGLKSAKKEKSENCTNQDASGKKEKKKKKVKNKKNDKEMDTTSAVRILSNGMEIEELDMGKPENKVADQGKKIKVTYTGKLVDGDIFDSNVNTRFRLGAGQVIEGLDIGIEGMRVGGRRRLKIPPSLGFGSEGDGEKVPPHSWLIYDIELIRVS